MRYWDALFAFLVAAAVAAALTPLTPWSAEANHFHHRMARMGYSPRRTVAYLYGWTLMLAGVAVALAATVYLIYLLDILKFKSRRSRALRTADPSTSEHEIEAQVQREVETGEFERVA